MNSISGRYLLPALAVALFVATGCASLKESNTAWPIKEYEKLIAGRLDADYVGSETCVAKCHAHDQLNRDFQLSIHGGQTAAATGMPLVNCESCHGPGSLAIENLVDDTCDFKTFIPIEDIPSGAQSLLCLKCHSSFSLANLSGWSASRHAVADLSCFNCHELHKGPAQKVSRDEVADLCLGCHKGIRSKLNLPSHHPVLEGKITCISCHNPHGGTLENNIVASSIRDLCTRCHAEKRGPFLVEHGTDLAENCTRCHDPHGSINSAMTTFAQPFLCMQCHSGHNTQRRPLLDSGTTESRRVFFGDCTDCHSTHHGTDFPGWRPDGRLYR